MVIDPAQGKQFGKPFAGGNPVGYFSKLYLDNGTESNPMDAFSVIQHAKVTLTSAQILALNTTPITLIAAPGAGYAIDVIDAIGILNYLTSAYTGSNDLTIAYTNSSGVADTATFPHATFMNASSTNIYKADSVASNVVTANAPVVAYVPTANPAAGAGNIEIDIAYRIVQLP